jgi:hypothetical protein
MSRPITFGDDDRGASEIADTLVAESTATVTAKKSSAFIVDGELIGRVRGERGEDVGLFEGKEEDWEKKVGKETP